jgi:hypothetical protein
MMPFLSGSTFDDPRPELKKFRRGTLKKICLEAGLEFDGNVSTADDLRRMVTSNNIDVKPYLGEQHRLGRGEAASKAIERLEKDKESLGKRVKDLEDKFMQLLDAKESAKEEVAESEAIEAGEFPTSFSEEDKTPIWRLRQYAKIAGIAFEKTDKAKDIIRKLNEYVAERR